MGGVACTPAADATWHEEDAGYRWRLLESARGSGEGFTPLEAAATGITHVNQVDDEHALANRNLLIGAGTALGDVTGDGRPDLFLASVEAPAALYRNDGGFRFTDVTVESGLDLAGRATTGAAMADVDGDGDVDLLVGTLGGPLLSYLNDGQGHFRDGTAASGLDSGFAATTLTLADVEGDGDLDLYVATYKTRNALDAYPPQARAFDQVVKKIGSTYQVLPQWTHEFRIEDRPDLGGIVRSQRAERDLFYLNDGTGTFVAQSTFGERWRDEAGQALSAAPDYFSLAARFYDVNDDGAPDLYVCNDFEDPDQFWINDGRGNFQLVPALAVRATSNTCMSVDFADVNRDGAVDFFTADMRSPTRVARQRQIPTHTPLPKTIGESPDRAQWMRNALQLARGDGTWAQIADFAGLEASDWTWGSAFLDIDLDGDEDLLTAAGHRWDVRDADTFERIRNAFPRVAWNREQGEFPRLAVPSPVFRNNGDLTFTDVGARWRYGRDSSIAHSITLGDLDGDGDQDVVVTRLNEPPVVYRNDARAGRVAVRLAGTRSNRAGIGAAVTVRAPSLPAQRREMTAGGLYLAGAEPILSFATGADSLVEIEVRWRDGTTSRVPNARPGRLYEVLQSSARPASAVAVADSGATSLFTDETSRLGGHRHAEALFDDFARQPLLPNRFSQLGPGLTWFDVDADGREDLVIGSGRPGELTVLRNAPAGFTAAQRLPVDGDVGTILPAHLPNGNTVLLAARGSYEDSTAAQTLSTGSVLAIPTGRSNAARRAGPWTAIPGDTASVGAMAMADVDGDGGLELFVGARVVPGAWPLPARSRLYRWSEGRAANGAGGGWTEDSRNAEAVGPLGLVTAATFADLNGDARPDLVVGTEWGPVRVLLNENGSLKDATAALGLSALTSRWLGVAAGDFDGNGALDLVATSWGRNTPWRAAAERPYVLAVARSGRSLALLFAQRDSLAGREMPLESFALLGTALPDVRARIASYADYAAADLQAVLGPMAASAVRVGATTFDHVVLLNRGSRFEVRPLPALAQLAPAPGPVVADFDGDGHEDLFLSQNFYPTEISTLRFDAGAGVLLIGDGAGGFIPRSVRASGISALGDGRGAATADFDGDTRADLAVAQNGARTRLFRNRGARAGLRVRLDGGPRNPLAIGAQLSVVQGTNAGPVREVRAGSGYWSMDGAITILASPDESAPSALLIRWPWGGSQRVDLAPGQREVVVRRNE
jgi:hypothetical protein